MASTTRTYPFATGNIFCVANLGGDGLENGLEDGPTRLTASGHQARALQRALFASGNSGAGVQQPLFFDVPGSAFRIRIVRIAPVDDDVAR